MGVGDDPADQPDAGMDLMEDLELPGKPGKLWNTVRDRVRAALSESDGSAAYSIGGGTVLAARWGHRESTDVDLLTTDPQGMVPKTARTERGLAETLNGELALGATARHVKVKTPDGPVDVTVDEPMPPGQERLATVNGREATVLSNCQILRGKLARTDESPARDVYDVVTAAERDRESLKEALGELAPETIEGVGRLWKATNRKLTLEAQRTITVRNGPPVNDIGIRGEKVLSDVLKEIERDRERKANPVPVPDRNDPAGLNQGMTRSRETRGPEYGR